MKKTFLLLTTLLTTMLVGCEQKYASQSQAQTACDEWTLEGDKIIYYYTGLWGDSLTKTTLLNRKCSLEESTNQYLGYQGVFSEKDRGLSGQKVDFPGLYTKNNKVVENFYY